MLHLGRLPNIHSIHDPRLYTGVHRFIDELLQENTAAIYSILHKFAHAARDELDDITVSRRNEKRI